MRRTTLLSWTLLGSIIVACGGSVSLGDVVGSNLGKTDGGPQPPATECSAKGACGPALGMPAITCSDGSIGGNTGRCLKQPDGACVWEIRQCPTAACFDASGQVDPALKKCNESADCVAVSVTTDCCGSQHVAGISAAEEAKVKQCAADRAAGFGQCRCAPDPTKADDGSTTDGGGAAAVRCNAAGACETSFKTTPCGSTFCTAAQTCCSGMPYPEPTCIGGTMCPISQRRYKKDISYLSQQDEQRLRDELLGFRLATYRYKSEAASDSEHLGFIIEDVAPSPAVTSSGERVDMYGYTTMAVATLRAQAREIADLRREIADLRGEMEEKRRR